MIQPKITQLPVLKLSLKIDLIRSIKRGHTWIYQNALKDHRPGKAGQRVELMDKRNRRMLAEGYYDPQSPIRMRICTLPENGKMSSGYLEGRLRQAIESRLKRFDEQLSNAYRLVNGSGDGLPGLVIDRYADTAVLKLDGSGAEAFWDMEKISQILTSYSSICRVFHKFKDQEQSTGRYLTNRNAKPELQIIENGLKFLVNHEEGQKTGFFLDQRENRKLLQTFTAGKQVLNMFGYTGGFSVYAGAAGATRVLTADLAQPALEMAERNWALNDLPAGKHAAVKADALAFLEEQRSSHKTWDVVVLDPPSYVHNEEHLKRGLNAYTNLIAAGAAVTAEDGILCASSCSSHVSMPAFLDCCTEGVSKARKKAIVMGIHQQPWDHPFPLAMPELNYLKFVILNIQP